MTTRPAARREGRLARWGTMPAFVGLTLLLSWSPLLVADGTLLPHGPMLAALAVLWVLAGRAAAGTLLRRLVAWRVGLRWWICAPGLVVVAHALALAAATAAGVVEVRPEALTWTVVAATVLPLVLLGGQWEEPGWLALLLDRLQGHRGWSPWLVLTLASIVRVAWHLPLAVEGVIPWFDLLLGVVALQVLLTWLYNVTGGSLLLPMVCHLTSNSAMALVRETLGEGEDHAYWAVYTAAVVLVALCLLVATRGRLGLRRSSDR
ncbi:CPBP family intramembrane glutamic endopeptidase [Nocardioides sp. SYSU D00038]|uniref:CPBP family intramembrane glutamic endopeptidase n=1 Tax=Nocardioides sp. SYSU D00038 TaxID=2812554 RepID=UPI00196783C3|nr:CPBP family intramembrane glutamic endopeptidase [Nocardioides sp. SYSU D00038]